ncbi:MAG: hypothetical protein NTY39_02205 [Campylobacterales bacterium]|nr:hypothetical protein [Campylobacterales bacterium]
MSFSNRFQGLRSLCQKYPFLYRFVCSPTILVYSDELPENIPNNSVMILPPRDYWAIQAVLNVKTAKEAATFGPALFDLGDEYRYAAQKTGKNSYSLIAYNPAEISHKLHAFPHTAVIEKFTFAQWVFADEEHPIRLDNGKILTTIEGVVIEIDSDYLHINGAIGINEALAKPRFFIQSIPVEQLSSPTLTSKTVKKTLFILILILGNLTAHTVLNYQEMGRLDSLKEEVLDHDKLPETSFERDALTRSLQKKEAGQLRLREQFLHISDLSIHATLPTNVNTPSQTVTPSSAPVEGVVLIPGSNPGEPNRLLVNGSSNIPTPSLLVFQGEGIDEIVYDGKNIKILLNASENKVKEDLKKAIMKPFKKAKISEHGNQLEVWIP